MQLSISRSLAELTKSTAVTVNTVLPGSTKSEGVAKFVQDLFPDLPPQEAELKFMRENRPTSLIERLLDPREIANLVTLALVEYEAAEARLQARSATQRLRALFDIADSQQDSESMKFAIASEAV